MGNGAAQPEATRDDALDFETMMAAAETAPPRGSIDDEAQPIPIEQPSEHALPAEPAWPRVALIVVALAWVLLVAWAMVSDARALTPERIVSSLALASGPLALIAVAWLIVMRSSRREADRLMQTGAALRAEAALIEAVAGRVADRTDTHRALIAAQAASLIQLGEDSEARLAHLGETLRRDTEIVSQHARRLDDAAESARTDLGVLLADLPRAEAQARAMSAALRDAGLGAHEQAGALDGLLATLTARGREADEVAGGAAQRLAAHLARIESVSEVAGARMEAAAEQMSGAVDGSLARAARAVDETRRALEDQSAAMLALVEQGEAAMGRVGMEAAIGMSKRISDVGRQIDALSARFAEQARVTDTMFAGITRALSDIETRSTVVSESGTARARTLHGAIETLAERLATVLDHVERGDVATGALIDRAGSLVTILDACTAELDERLPATFDRIEQRSSQAREAATAAAPLVEALAAAAGSAAESLDDAETAIARQQASLELVGDRLQTVREATGELSERIVALDGEARTLAEGAGGQLIDALLRVRETGAQAADHARTAIQAVIPDSAARLAKAAGEAMDAALVDRVEQQMGEISTAAERAVEAAHKATDRLMRQMITIADTTSSIEARIAEARAEVQEADGNSFSRRVALLVESLNSTAIDVAKILSNDVTDTAWTAYLKGDRGIFTRRAVRLLDTGEAREIARHYEEDLEFRNQVNRYIHDFEAMLRDILANRDGTPLGVTLLSSDMGKLYVALAQAIERLR
jgi:hypothetical protein